MGQKDKKRSGNACFALKFVLFSLVFAAIAVFMGYMLKSYIESAVSRLKSVEASAPSVKTVIIDPGHGGEDGGCSSASGLLEKELNLEVSENLRDLFLLFGIDVKMTRTEDKLLYDMYGDLTDYKGHKKTYDLRNRLRFAQDNNSSLLISVHMNKFPDEKYSGLQVYYSPNASQSSEAAEIIQSYTQMYLQPENTRKTKKATSSIYLLERIKSPAVMVECGFLSNSREAALLGDTAYRRELSMTIFCAVMEYLSMTA